MNQRAFSQFYLVPESGIELVAGQTVASTGPAWLRIEPISALARCSWVRMRYSASYFDEPVRPLIRFVLTNGDDVTLPMNGPVLGTAEWIGRVPGNTASAFISPVRRMGSFDFRLESISPIPRVALILQGLRGRRPGWLYWACRSRVLNSRREAWQALSFAAGGTPMDDYAGWHARLARPIELAGFDRPRTDWRRGPVFRLVLNLAGSDPDRLRRTIESLRAQIYPRWFLHAAADATMEPRLLAAFRELGHGDSRVSKTPLDFEHSDLPESTKGGSDLLAMSDPGDLLAVIDVGDGLAEYALAVVAEEIARWPRADFIYADEDCVTPDGILHSPALKPDWSPILQNEIGYTGRCAFFRAAAITPQGLRQLVADRQTAIDDLTKDLPRESIRHIRRILYSRLSPSAAEEPQTLTVHSANRGTDDQAQWPDVAIVIATRDHGKLLAECLRGLREKTDYPHCELIVMDNGSTAPDAVRLLQQIADEPRTTVLHRPGPFNFSALSNEGARASNAPVLLFINNDIAMLDSGWLKAMVRWAIKRDIGVVGAKLIFPTGVIQHAGVVLGMGAIAGHVYLRSPVGHRGYLSELAVPREVTAVTAACIAIERSKFEAVGGFDAENLPVDLNDMDLCLRVGEHGWTNLWTPQATLIHHQSGTRGIDPDPFEFYRKERTYFVKRWANAIRDDPYFHPGLSLYAHDVALA
jgi:GT2 family glycosyltransferase